MQDDSEVKNGDRIERQSAAFNMLEFATYMSGRAYQPLEGSSSPSPMDPFRKGNWFVVGRNIYPIKMTEEMARVEFEDRADKNPALILIELTPQDHARICLARDREWSPWNRSYAKLFLLLIDNPRIPKVDLERKVVAKDEASPSANPSAKFRQIKKRAKEGIVTLMENPFLEVFDGDQLSNEVPILGLVHGPSFR